MPRVALKTILLPVSNRVQARNILRTEVFTTLAAAENIRLVLCVPDYKVAEYTKEFSSERVLVDGYKDSARFVSGVDEWFNRLALFYINNKTVRLLRRKWLWLERREPLRYIAALAALFIVGSLRPLRVLARYLDTVFVHDGRRAMFFEKYQPDCVILPNVAVPVIRSFLREAKKRNIFTVGMIQSWDNITCSKYPYRLLPQKLIVHNEMLKKEAMKYLDMPEKDIFVSGLPHFDHYVTMERSSREEFCRGVGVDSGKRIILFASVTELVNDTEWQTLYLLDQALREERLPNEVVVIVRHHPVQDMKIGSVSYSSRIVFDDSKTRFRGDGKEYTEVLKRDMRHLADSIFHSAMIITTSSTMAIDGAALDKPVIDIGFDGWEKRPLHESVRRYYTPYRGFYQNIVNTGGVTVAYSMDELITAIKRYLDNPSLHQEGRKRIVEEQCYKLDGQAGRRIADFILDSIKLVSR